MTVPTTAHDGDSGPNRSELARATSIIGRFSTGYTAIFDEHLGTNYASNEQIHAIALLAARRPMTTTELVSETGMTRRTANELTKLLVGAGTGERSKSPRDRRATIIVPTPLGRRRLERLMVAVRDFLSSFDEADELVRILRGTLAHFETTETPATESVETTDLLISISAVGEAMNDAYLRRSPPRPPTGNHLLALLSIATRGRRRPNELADDLALTSGGMSYVLNQLEDRELIHRTYGELDDRRAIVVSLTASGADVVDSFHRAVGDVAAELCSLFQTIRDLHVSGVRAE